MGSPLKREYRGARREEGTPIVNNDGYGSNWYWDPIREYAAELIAQGYSNQQAADECGRSITTIRNWLKVKEFNDRIDEIVLETGAAKRRDRIALMKRMFTKLEGVFTHKIEELMRDSTEESIKAIASEMRELLKQIAQEKEEFVELTRIEHSGSMTVVQASIEEVEEILKNKSVTEREKLMAEFSKVADNVLAGIVRPTD